MNITLIRGATAATAVTALAVAGAGVAVATGAGDPQGPGSPSGAARAGTARTTPGVLACDGGRQKSSKTRVYSSPTTFGEGSVTTPPGGSVVVRGPSRGADTLNVTFSGEANLLGSTDVDERWDWMGIEVHVDGSPIKPYTAAGDVYAFASPGGYESNAAQFCTRIGRGKHRVEVKLNLVDGADANTLTGWIDDHTLQVVTSD